MTGWILTLIIATISTGCVFGIPPSRTEVGWAGGDQQPGRTRFATGASLTSIAPAEATRLELGVGLLYESGDEGRMAPATRGPYADVGVAVFRNSYSRLIVGLRGERRWQDHDMHYATKLRVDLEAFSRGSGPFSGAGQCGVVSGAWSGMRGIGVYAEAGAAWMPGDPTWLATAGVTVRLPAAGGVMIGVPGCSSHDSGGGGSSGSSWNPSRNH